MFSYLIKYAWIFSISFTVLFASGSGAAVSLKIASMAPEGTSWGDALRSMANEVKSKTNGEVIFKMYLGGIAGDEPVVLRKIRGNQFQGGVFTGRALGDVNGDVRVMEVPFSFEHQRDVAWATLNKGREHFDQGFLKNGFKNLGFFEIGPVYLVSTKKIEDFNALKNIKIWSWSGDKISSTLIEGLKLSGVPLQLQDVLMSLETGVVQAAYSSPLGILAMQWQSKVKYLIDYPMTFSVGALLLSNRGWGKIPQKWQKVVLDVIQKHVDEANKKTIQGNDDALTAMKNNGVEFIKFQLEDINLITQARRGLVDKLVGKLFSKEALAILENGRKTLKTTTTETQTMSKKNNSGSGS